LLTGSNIQAGFSYKVHREKHVVLAATTDFKTAPQRETETGEPLAKFHEDYEKCQGTTSVVPKDDQKDVGLYRLRKKA
jgi:hypothetical protein